MKKNLNRVCPVCGTKFLASIGNQKYCCVECSHKEIEKTKEAYRKKYRSQNKTKREPVACAWCGKMFTPRDDRNRCCCSDCAKKLWKKSRASGISAETVKPAKKTYHLVCAVCGENFTADYPSKRYCSKTCAAVARNHFLKNAELKTAAQVNKRYAGNTLSVLGKINVNRWHRLQLRDGTRATNKKPWSSLECAKVMGVPVPEVEKAFAEYEKAVIA